MKVSTRVEYGMLALADIAIHSGDGTSVSAPDIAERQDISRKYLEQILTHLRQAGLINAQKGLKGGYTLSRPAGSIRLSEVLNALDNSILEETETDTDGQSLRGAVNACLWQELNRSMTEFAESRTLEALTEECENHLAGSWDMYMI